MPNPFPPTRDGEYDADALATDFGSPPKFAGDAPAGPTFASVQDTTEYYDENTMDCRYEYVSGDCVMVPMAADGAVGQRVKLHAGRWYYTVEWSYQRMNEWPQCPHPDTGDPNLVLKYATIQPAKPQEGIGQRIFRVSGRYVYELVAPYIDLAPSLATPTSPESTATHSDNMLPASYFERGRIPTTQGLVRGPN